jgi:hypothetical protein
MVTHSGSYYSTARTLTIIGAILVIVGSIVGMFSSTPTLESVIGGVILIIISLVLLDATGLISIRLKVSFTWVILLVLVIIQAVVTGFTLNVVSFVGLGLLLQIVSVILLIL